MFFFVNIGYGSGVAGYGGIKLSRNNSDRFALFDKIVSVKFDIRIIILTKKSRQLTPPRKFYLSP